MSKWNPTNPQIAGDEWQGASLGIAQATRALGVGAVLVAESSDNIDTIETVLRGLANPSRLVVDIYDLANPVVDVEEVVILVPGANRTNGAGWEKATGGVFTAYDANAHNNIDDVVGETDPINTGATTQLVYVGIGLPTLSQIMFNGPSANIYDGNTGAPGAAYAGKRINSVTVLGIVENADDTGNVRFDGFLTMGGTRYASDSGPIIIKAGAGLLRARFHFYNNPATGRPWCEADIDALNDATYGYGLGVVTKNKFGNFTVTTVNLRIHCQPERRLATGFGNSTTFDQYSGFALVSTVDHVTPATWVKASGSRYFVCFSACKTGGPGQFAVIVTSAVKGHENDLLPGSNFATINLAPGNTPAGNPVEAPGQFAMLLIDSGSASPDTNPYADVVEEPIGTGPGAIPTATQKFSTETTDQYGMAFILCGVTGNGAGGALQDSTLEVTLRLQSDDSILAGPAFLSPEDVPADGKYHVARVPFDVPASLGAGDPVYLRVDSTSSVAWRLPLLVSRSRFMSSADAFSILAGDAGIGGGADNAGEPTIDWPWAIVTAPDPPSNPASIDNCQPNIPALAYSPVLKGLNPEQPANVCFASLTWDPTALGGSFLYYEVQRADLDGTWRTIAHITDEASSFWNDIECLRNVEQLYRVRTVRNDLAFSTWLEFPGLAVSTDGECDIVLASNLAPERSQAVVDLGAVHAWAPRQAQSPTYVDIFGREDPVGFFGAEDGGESFTREICVAMNDAAVGDSLVRDRAIFDDLLSLLHDRTLPSVAYCDGWGRRWYISAVVQNPRRTEPAGQYVATVLFTQVARVPAIVTTDSPWTFIL